jgi:hypothetical protein
MRKVYAGAALLLARLLRLSSPSQTRAGRGPPVEGIRHLATLFLEALCSFSRATWRAITTARALIHMWTIPASELSSSQLDQLQADEQDAPGHLQGRLEGCGKG